MIALHTPLVILLCSAGAIGHLLSITLLSRMLNPTNLLLISMSGNQLALCVNYLYSTLFKYGAEDLCVARFWSYGWTFSLLVSVNVSVVISMLSTFHVVAISVIRHFTLQHLAQINSSQQWFTYQKCVRSLLAIYASVFLVCTPLYFQSEIVSGNPSADQCSERSREGGDNNALPASDSRDAFRLAFSDNQLLTSVNFWLFGCFAKLVPCAIIGVMTLFIVDSLKRIRLLSVRFQTVERDAHYHRTTNIILAIMFLFVLVEFPQGILAVVQPLLTAHSAHMGVLGDLFEVLTLLNSCLIFALLCSMNSKIRGAFFERFTNLVSLSPFARQRLKLVLSNADGTIGSSPLREGRIGCKTETQTTPNSSNERRILVVVSDSSS